MAEGVGGWGAEGVGGWGGLLRVWVTGGVGG